MKTSITSRTRIAARVGVTLAAFAAFGCAADDPGMAKTASLTAPLPNIDAISTGGQQCDSRSAAHTLSLQDPQGAALELAYVPGCGWQYTAQKSRGAIAMSAMHPISASHAAGAAQPENPLAVFIDGPTGYAFAWTRDAGWKFIGHVEERKSR
jgi:hypothetical protein